MRDPQSVEDLLSDFAAESLPGRYNLRQWYAEAATVGIKKMSATLNAHNMTVIYKLNNAYTRRGSESDSHMILKHGCTELYSLECSSLLGKKISSGLLGGQGFTLDTTFPGLGYCV